MSDAFRRALGFVLDAEGGFVDDPRDPGGATNRGITIGALRRQGAWGDFDCDGDIDADDARLISVEEAARIYRDQYWSVVRGGELPAYLALLVFDAAVNQGPRTAVALLQIVLRLQADGVMGPRTIAKARDAPPVPTVEAYAAQRAFHYGTRAGFPSFGLGWLRRLAHVQTGALMMIA